jgi:hypothetical protein
VFLKADDVGLQMLKKILSGLLQAYDGGETLNGFVLAFHGW